MARLGLSARQNGLSHDGLRVPLGCAQRESGTACRMKRDRWRGIRLSHSRSHALMGLPGPENVRDMLLVLSRPRLHYFKALKGFSGARGIVEMGSLAPFKTGR